MSKYKMKLKTKRKYKDTYQYYNAPVAQQNIKMRQKNKANVLIPCDRCHIYQAQTLWYMVFYLGTVSSLHVYNLM